MLSVPRRDSSKDSVVCFVKGVWQIRQCFLEAKEIDALGKNI